MRFRFFVVTLLIVLLGISAGAQVASSRKDDYTQSRILILLDESSSMLQKWPSGKEKYKAADELILKIMDSVYTYNSEVEFSLRVFGHQYPMQENNCYDTKNEVAFSKSNRQQMSLRLDDITPRGVTPIAYALREAARYDLVDEVHNAYSIILITDGGESCGGDICDVMQTLMKNKIYFKPYIISLENDPQLKTTYSCMGDFLQVTRKEDINRAVGTIIEAYKPLINITTAEYKQIKSVAASVPSVLKTNIPPIRLNDTVGAKPVPPPPAPKKDSIIPEAPKPHAIKVDEPWKKPAAENITTLTIAAPRPLFEHKPTPPKPEKREIPEMPVVKIEEPEAPPPVVQHTVQAIDKLRMAPRVSMAITAAPEAAIKSVAVPELPAIVVETPAPVPQPVAISKAAMAKVRQLAMAEPAMSKLLRVDVPTLPSIEIEIPVERPKAEKYDRLVISKLIIQGFTPLEPYVVKKSATIPAMPDIKVAIDTPPVPRVVQKITKIKVLPAHIFHNITIFDERNIPYQNVPPMPDIKIDIAPPPVAATPPKATPPKATKQTPPATEPAKKVDYKLETEDAKETSVEVYFTNGKGKFYTTTPQILVLDSKTQAVVKKFYRTVDENGNPDVQNNVPTGTFDFAVTERRSLHIHSVAVLPNKKNKIIFTVRPASLSFAYAEANGMPGKRPVSEFSAMVIERNKAQGRVQTQKCTEALEYEPGNYHIEINTFPKDVRNVDIDFDESVITIAQPGFAKFAGDGKLRQVTLYQRLGDKFLAFYTLDLADPQSQHLRMQPGEYQVHFSKGPAGVRAPEKVISFRVVSNQDTDVQLQ